MNKMHVTLMVAVHACFMQAFAMHRDVQAAQPVKHQNGTQTRQNDDLDGVTTGRSPAEQALAPKDAQSATDQPTTGRDKQLDETSVLAFVAEHQPRLRKLMTFLKNKQPAQYQQALREMSRAQRRLNALEERDQEMYKIELQLWQTRSKLRLVAAEISVSANAGRKRAAEQTLNELIDQELKLELTRLKLQRDRAQKQLARFQELIQQRQSESEDLAARALKMWKNRIERQAPNRNSNKTTNSNETTKTEGVRE